MSFFRLPVTVYAILVPSLVLAQARLSVTVQGRPAGNVQVTQRLLANGGKLLQIATTRAMAGSPQLTTRLESTYDAKGEPVRIFLETVVAEPRSRRTVTVTFDDAGANAVIEENGKRTTRKVPLARPAPRANPSEFWFLRDRPKPGTTVVYFHFDTNQLDWRRSEVTYVGTRTVSLKGRSMEVHVLKTDRGEAWSDKGGLPVFVDLGVAQMTRE